MENEVWLEITDKLGKAQGILKEVMGVVPVKEWLAKEKECCERERQGLPCNVADIGTANIVGEVEYAVVKARDAVNEALKRVASVIVRLGEVKADIAKEEIDYYGVKDKEYLRKEELKIEDVDYYNSNNDKKIPVDKLYEEKRWNNSGGPYGDNEC